MPEVIKETKELNTNNVRREKQVVDLRPLAYSIGAFAVVALFFLMFNIWKEVNDRYLINCGSKNLVDEHSWEEGVKVNWLVHRTDLIKDIKGVKRVQLFVKANVSNKNLKQYLSVSSITLELLSKSGITLSSHSEKLNWENYNSSDMPEGWSADRRIEPGKSEETTFNYWVPVKIYKEITSLSAKLGYSLSK